MKRWKRHLKKNRNRFCFILILLIAACQKEKPVPDDFVARVNEEYLFEEDTQLFLDEHENDSTRLKLFIRKWIRDRVLLDNARKKELDTEPEYLNTIDRVKEDILISSLFQYLLEEEMDKISESALENFYLRNEELFALESSLYTFNFISFPDKESAYKFYKMSGEHINARIDSYNDHNNKNIKYTMLVLREHNFTSPALFKSVKSLRKMQFSRPFQSEQNTFHIVQLINKYKEGTVPKFTLIKKEVEEFYLASRKKQIINNFVSRSLDEYDIEIREELD